MSTQALYMFLITIAGTITRCHTSFVWFALTSHDLHLLYK